MWCQVHIYHGWPLNQNVRLELHSQMPTVGRTTMWNKKEGHGIGRWQRNCEACMPMGIQTWHFSLESSGQQESTHNFYHMQTASVSSKEMELVSLSWSKWRLLYKILTRLFHGMVKEKAFSIAMGERTAWGIWMSPGQRESRVDWMNMTSILDLARREEGAE